MPINESGIYVWIGIICFVSRPIIPLRMSVIVA